MYKKILVPLDGSETSESALPHVKAVALGCSVPEVVLLRVVEPILNPEAEDIAPAGRDLMAQVEEQNKARDRAYLNSIVEKLKADGITAEAFLGYGRPADEILDFVQKHNIDLIIMSTHGRSGVTRLVMGSVTERVLRHSPVPILTVSPTSAGAQ